MVKLENRKGFGFNIGKYIREETLGGFLLIMVTIIALDWANSEYYGLYHHIFHEIEAGFPLFALANAGVRIEGNIMDMLFHPVALGIMAGLILGKFIGISLFSRLLVKFRLASLPEGVT